MGQGTSRLVIGNGAIDRVRAIEQETRETRDHLDRLVRELDGRRHDALDVKLQVRRHGRALAAVLGGVIAIGAAVEFAIARRRRPPTLTARVADLADRADRLRLALGRIVEDPDRLARTEPPSRHSVPTAVSAALEAARLLIPPVVAAVAARHARRRP